MISARKTSLILALGFIILAVLATACAQPRENDTSAQTNAAPPGVRGPEGGWDSPPIGTQRVASFQEASQKVGFQVRPPNGLGTPVGIYVWTCDDPPVCSREATIVYQQKTFGYVWVGQRYDPRTTAQWNQWSSQEVQDFNAAAANTGPGMPPRTEPGAGETVSTIRGSTSALIQWHGDSNAGAQINWRDGSIEWSLATQFADRDKAIGLANNL